MQYLFPILLAVSCIISIICISLKIISMKNSKKITEKSFNYQKVQNVSSNKFFSFLDNLDFEITDDPLTEDEISEFEKMNKIILPSDYKLFLTTIGNGIKINTGSLFPRCIDGISRPINSQYNRRLQHDFIFDRRFDARIKTHSFSLREDCENQNLENSNKCKECLHNIDCFFAITNSCSEFDHVIYNGALPICFAGCTYVYFLIVSGDNRGEVWMNVEDEYFTPVKPTFTEFLEWASTAECI